MEWHEIAERYQKEAVEEYKKLPEYREIFRCEACGCYLPPNEKFPPVKIRLNELSIPRISIIGKL